MARRMLRGARGAGAGREALSLPTVGPKLGGLGRLGGGAPPPMGDFSDVGDAPAPPVVKKRGRRGGPTGRRNGGGRPGGY